MVSALTEINAGDAPDLPEALRIAPEGQVIAAVSIVVGGNRQVSFLTEIDEGQSLHLPQTD